MIREAQTTDYPRLLEMAKSYLASTELKSAIDDASFLRSVEVLSTSDDSVVFVQDNDGEAVGMAAGTLIPRYYNYHEKIAHEVFTWVDEEHRAHGMDLFDALENWARKQKAHQFTIARRSGFRDAAMHRIYIAKGFTETDSFYSKVF